MSEAKFRPIPVLTPTQIEKFNRLVPQGLPEDTCWTWQGCIPNCYGNISLNSLNFAAHRVMYWLFYSINVGNIAVLHKCDNPPCVNPHHLFLGTCGDNNRDRARKGRSAKTKRWYKFGSQIPSSKLKEGQIPEILDKHQQGAGIRPLAREYGVTPLVIRLIVRRKSWKHVIWHEVEGRRR